MSKHNGILPKLLIWLGIVILWACPAWSNNLKISNVSLEDRNPTNNTVVVEFDISWDNSWKDSINHDATWVFLKACNTWNGTKCTAAYKHGSLSGAGTNQTGTSYGSNGNVEVFIPFDRKGAFIRRNATGSGSLSSTNVRLVMDYGDSGIADSDSIVVKVYGIEMAYVPDGPYYLGDGSGASESTYAFHKNGVDNTTIQITTTSNDITVDSNGSDDIDTTPIAVDGDNGIGGNADWPNGYPAFYLMKYEITQGQYNDFLNTLSRAQQNTRTETNVSTDAITNIYVMFNGAAIYARNGIQCPSTGNGTTDPITFGCSFDTDTIYNEVNDGQNIVANYLQVQDVFAYGDWAGLRPMTELEYEKATRGTLSAVYAERAWGSTALTQAQGPLVNSGVSAEKVSNSGPGLANYDGPGTDLNAPLRAGYAATTSTDRVTSGSGYYGNMEMSGNLWERSVTIGNSTGRLFRGTHGDGTLTTTSSYEGNATNTDWPGIDATIARGVTGATGTGMKGAGYLEFDYLNISDRFYASTTLSNRTESFGGRLARDEAENYVKISDTAGNFNAVLDNIDYFGWSLAALGDLDGTGVSSHAIAVGAQQDDDGGGARGAVYILFIGKDGNVKSEQKISDTVGGFNAVLENSDLFGSAVASLGDLDGAGASAGAIAVGCYGDDDGGNGRGSVYILFLNTSGVVTSEQKISNTAGSFSGVLDDTDFMGSSVASLGDLDGVGGSASAIAVGAAQDDDGGTDRGAVWILFLNTNGTVSSYQKISATAGSFSGTLENNNYFGWAIASLGDLDGSGGSAGAIAVGQQGDDGGSDRGAVWILFLNTNGTVSSYQKISDTAGNFAGILDNSDFFGSSVTSLGDLDGPGGSAGAIAVGATNDDDGGSNRGAVWVLFLNTNGTVSNYQKISDIEGNFGGVLDDSDQFSQSVASLGDLDGAGGSAGAVLVGAHADDDGGDARGAVYIIYLDQSGKGKELKLWQ